MNLKLFFANPANAFKVSPKDFPLVLMKLHAQFSWPYPVTVINNAFVISPSSHSLNSISVIEGNIYRNFLV